MKRRPFWRVWVVPLVLAGLTVFGLLAALLGTGIWHDLAWIALMLPIMVAARFALRPRRC